MLVSFLVKIVSPTLEPDEVKQIAADMTLLHDKMLYEGKKLLKYNKAVKRGKVVGTIKAVPLHLKLIMFLNKSISKVFLFIFGFVLEKKVSQQIDTEHEKKVAEDMEVFVHYYMKWRR